MNIIADDEAGQKTNIKTTTKSQKVNVRTLATITLHNQISPSPSNSLPCPFITLPHYLKLPYSLPCPFITPPHYLNSPTLYALNKPIHQVYLPTSTCQLNLLAICLSCGKRLLSSFCSFVDKNVTFPASTNNSRAINETEDTEKFVDRDRLVLGNEALFTATGVADEKVDGIGGGFLCGRVS